MKNPYGFTHTEFDAVSWYLREGKKLATEHSPIVLLTAALFSVMDDDYVACPVPEAFGSALCLAIERIRTWRNPVEGIERGVADLRELFHDDPVVARAEKQAQQLSRPQEKQQSE